MSFLLFTFNRQAMLQVSPWGYHTIFKRFPASTKAGPGIVAMAVWV
jgi:hypothetical protein